MKQRILFVCLGNICRSPAAHGIMERLVQEDAGGCEIMVDSAGTYGGHAGDLPDRRMISAAAVRGYELTHRSRQIRQEDFDDCDMIVVMDDMNYEAVHRLVPFREYGGKIFRMADFFRSHSDWTYIPDPYYEGHDGFETVLDLLEDGCSGILDYIKNLNRN